AAAYSVRLSTSTAWVARVAMSARWAAELISVASALTKLSECTPSQVMPAASADNSITTAMILVRTWKRARRDMVVSDGVDASEGCQWRGAGAARGRGGAQR